MSLLWPVIKGFGRGSFCDFFSLIVEHGHGNDLESFALLCWSLWSACNMMVFQDKSETSDDIIERGERMKTSYHLLEHNQLPWPQLW